MIIFVAGVIFLLFLNVLALDRREIEEIKIIMKERCIIITTIILTGTVCGVALFYCRDDPGHLEERKILKGLLNNDQEAVKEVLEAGKMSTKDTLKYLILYKEQFDE